MDLSPVKLALRILNIFKRDLWIITGEETTSSQRLTIVYAGREKNKNFWINLAFNSCYREDYIGQVWIWKIRWMIKKKGYDSYLIIREVPRSLRMLFDSKHAFYIPC